MASRKVFTKGIQIEAGKCTDEMKLKITNASWGKRSVRFWNRLPQNLRIERNPKKLKKSLHAWTMENIVMFAGKDEGESNDNF